MRMVVNWVVSALAIIITAYLLPGVHVSSLITALVIAVVLGVINAFIKPIFVLLTFPITIMTLGLFGLVLNALFILLAAAIVPGFQVDGFWWALLFSIVLALINAFFHMVKD